MTELSEEEVKTLKEVAQNLQSAGRVGRVIQTSLIWIAALIGSALIVWEFILKGLGKQ